VAESQDKSSLQNKIEKKLSDAGYQTKFDVDISKDTRSFKPFNSILKSVSLYKILISSSIPAREAEVAVTCDGTVFLMPEEMKNILSERLISSLTEQNALEIAHLYVLLTSSYSRLLHSISDIKGLDVSKIKSNKYNEVIRPPHAVKNSNGYSVSLYTWNSMGGVVVKWDMVIENSLHINGAYKVIDINVGDYDVVQ